VNRISLKYAGEVGVSHGMRVETGRKKAAGVGSGFGEVGAGELGKERDFSKPAGGMKKVGSVQGGWKVYTPGFELHVWGIFS